MELDDGDVIDGPDVISGNSNHHQIPQQTVSPAKMLILFLGYNRQSCSAYADHSAV